MKKKTSSKTMRSTEEVVAFHERFDIRIDTTEARKTFYNRATNYIVTNFLDAKFDRTDLRSKIFWQVANGLGEKWEFGRDFDSYTRKDFHRCLHAIEIIFKGLDDIDLKKQLNNLILLILSQCEIDLGIRWEKGQFIRSGAELLDHELVNKSLRWLSDKKLMTVYEPFSKGLTHFLESERRSELLIDVITDMYESIEALAKIVTKREAKDLSANAELFIREIKASERYKRILKEYILYANEFRHALKEGQKRIIPARNEVESFIYLTGLFIRITIEA